MADGEKQQVERDSRLLLCLWNYRSRNLEVDSSRYGCVSDVCWLWNNCDQK